MVSTQIQFMYLMFPPLIIVSSNQFATCLYTRIDAWSKSDRGGQVMAVLSNSHGSGGNLNIHYALFFGKPPLKRSGKFQVSVESCLWSEDCCVVLAGTTPTEAPQHYPKLPAEFAVNRAVQHGVGHVVEERQVAGQVGGDPKTLEVQPLDDVRIKDEHKA